MNYPFEFKEMLLTDKVLNLLGFSQYCGGASEYGERSFGIEGVEIYRIVENDEQDDPAAGYGYGDPEYCSCHYSQPSKSKTYGSIYFLHELYESIKENNPNLLEMFVEKTKEKGVNMYPYIKSYLDYKENKLKK